MPRPPASEVEVALLAPGDEDLLADAAPDVFDRSVRPDLAGELLADPRHHIVVAREGGRVVGFASAVDYLHPDKPRELWINEIGVAAPHRGHGIGGRLLGALLDHGRELGCAGAWVLTDRDNRPAARLYESTGGVEAREETVMYTFDLTDEPY